MQEVPPAIPGEAWFKSSYSGAGHTECVEAAYAADGTASVRDSKRTTGPVLGFSSAAWAGFVAAIRNGAIT
ncbi:DUF397 domain-containing protein [Streptomyces abikoensis]|uniref:DUF397 domain-containing protein n=1 Tax=Streptomyces abikoensis TaxID=97398 RepID=UPI00371ADD56